MSKFPSAPVLEFDELMYFVDENQGMGIGIGFVDVNLLASARLSGTSLWTADKRLNAAAAKLCLNYKQHTTAYLGSIFI
jgi:hypothetical protein